jgi:hypothetical protein
LRAGGLFAAGCIGYVMLCGGPGTKVVERAYVGKGHMISDIQLPKIMPASAFDSN